MLDTGYFAYNSVLLESNDTLQPIRIKQSQGPVCSSLQLHYSSSLRQFKSF